MLESSVLIILHLDLNKAQSVAMTLMVVITEQSDFIFWSVRVLQRNRSNRGACVCVFVQES